MPTPILRAGSQAAITHLHASFLAILPRIVTHGRVFFRFVRCPIGREDAIAEMVALTWKWYIRLTQRGKDANQFVSALATFAARAVNSGRRVCGQEGAKDVMSRQAQREHGFVVQRLPDYSTLSTNPLAEALQDNTHTPIPEQVAFRSDFPSWRLSRSERDRRVVDELVIGERPMQVSRRLGLSPSRVSQLRRDFREDWARFCADPGEMIQVIG